MLDRSAEEERKNDFDQLMALSLKETAKSIAAVRVVAAQVGGGGG